MNDENTARRHDRAASAAFYMETFRAQMDPEQYGVLAQALH